MRLWSTVVSQLTTRPSFHVGASASLRTATGRPLPQRFVRPDVGDQRIELDADPPAPDRRHVAVEVGRVLTVIDDEVAQRAAVQERAVACDRRTDVTLTLEPVALGARGD